MTLRPALSALRASAPAKSPGTEIKARFASGSWRQAERNVSGRSSCGVSFRCAGRSISSAARCSVESAMARSCARTATSRSPGPAIMPSSTRPASERISQLAGVAIIRAASSTPWIAVNSRDICISTTESRKTPARTVLTVTLMKVPAFLQALEALFQNTPSVL